MLLEDGELELEPPEGDVLLDPLKGEVLELLELPGVVALLSGDEDPDAPGVVELEEPDEEELGADGEVLGGDVLGGVVMPEDPLLEDEPGGDAELPAPALPVLGLRSPQAAKVATAAAAHSIARLRSLNSMLSLLEGK